jgi:hypothetical protein
MARFSFWSASRCQRRYSPCNDNCWHTVPIDLLEREVAQCARTIRLKHVLLIVLAGVLLCPVGRGDSF